MSKKTTSKKIKDRLNGKGPVLLDLGCGDNKREGFKGVDKFKTPSVDVIHDLNKYPYPFESDSVDEIHCSHFIEHVEDIVKFMNECHRILKKAGQMMVIAPYYSSMRAWQDPTHIRAISDATFLYYNAEWRKTNKLDHYLGITADFEFRVGYAYNQSVQGRAPEWINFATRHYINIIDDIHVSLTKR